MEDLKSKTKKSLLWNAVDKVGMQLVALIVGIYTMRHLSSEDMGLIGALAVFVTIGTLLVDGGLCTTLVRREKNTNSEYSAAFFFACGVSIVIYIFVFCMAGPLAEWYELPKLKWLSRFLFLIFVFSAFSVVQTAVLMRNMDFKKLSIANISGVCVSGLIAIWMAGAGYGYWALAMQQVSLVAVRSAMLWALSQQKWFTWRADFSVLPELVRFGGALMLASCITQVGRNIQNVFIGKWCNISHLGNYYTAKKYESIAESVVTQIVSQVAVPMLTQVRDDAERQMRVFRRMVQLSAMVVFPVMLGIVVLYRDFVVLALTEKWLPSTPYYALLTIPGMICPFTSLMNNFMVVNGKNLYYPFLETVKMVLITIPIIALAVDAVCFEGIWLIGLLGGEPRIIVMLMLIVVGWIVCLCVFLYMMHRGWGYGLIDFIKDIVPFLTAGVFMVVASKAVGECVEVMMVRMTVQAFAGACVYLLTLRILKCDIYMEGRKNVIEKLNKILGNK